MNFFKKLPASAQGALAVMTLCAPIVAMAAMQNPDLLVWFFAAYIFLTFVGGLAGFIVDASRKKKAHGFSEDIKDNAASTQGVSDPNKRREIDEMRQQFQRGIDIYKQYGKDLYSLPWYVVVGEAGSGKTEALRRSEIGFPDKLQDYWQGTGGTISMHWWFTNRAVILDTAGRLFVRDSNSAGDSTQSQWTSFLQMLRKNRSDCPINGLILVIPATSLVPLEDEASEAASLKEIDNKAGQIAKQMETIQTELSVRFPVYVLVTKTDRILGFREFFSYVETPEERYQMLGWSNPEPLGKLFDPSAVAGYLRETADRLRRRRMALMKDPVPAPGHKRFDEVDSMFAFPGSFENLAPKLERYLRHIFAVDEWSAKPPFLRGIYFTSALQQGAVLDEAIAKALGMSIQDLEHKTGDQDLSLSRNRSYFLRDFFLDKVFQEKGLVTRGKIAGAISGWKLWIPLGFATALLLVGLAGWFTGRKPPGELKAWRFLAEDAYSTENYGFHPLVVPGKDGGWAYINDPVRANDLLRNLNQLGSEHLKARPKFGWLFAPAAALDGGVKEDRTAAFKTAADAIVTKPLLEAAIDGLDDRSKNWSDEGIPQSDVESLEEILAIFQPESSVEEDGKEKKERDLESTAGALLRSAGLPFTTSKNRDLYRDTVGPLVGVLKSAHPDGCLPDSAIDPRSRDVLAGIIARLLGGGDGSVLTTQLEAFDKAWKELQAVTPGTSFTEAEAKVRAVNTAAENLKNSEPQLAFLVSGTTKDKSEEKDDADEKEQPRVLGKRLLKERSDALRKIGGSKVDSWQELADRPEESGEVAQRRAELAKAHALMLPDGSSRNFAAKAALATEILALNAVVPERLNLASAEASAAAITRVQERAKALGMEEAGKTLLGLWADQFTATVLPKHVGFPLIFDQIVGGQERVLQRDEAAAATVLSLKLASLSDKSRSKLAPIKAVAESIFDLEKLAKSEIVTKEWEISLDQTGNIWFGVVNDVTVTTTRPGLILKWEAATGGEGKLIAADLGAKLTFTDTNEPPKKYAFASGNHDLWAPVRWAVASISRSAQGASTTFAGKKITVFVKLPATFPAVLDELPVTRKLSD